MATEKPRKRQLERDDDEYGEEADTFDTDGPGLSRRGRKEGRRVSGVYREIKSLQSIGTNASVMELVFERLPLKEVMNVGPCSSMWYITACHEMRKRFGNAPFLRLWTSQTFKNHLSMEWDLHFHEQLLSGFEEEDEPMEQIKSARQLATFPCVDSIISIGSRAAYEQFIHDDAKLPLRQDHVYMTCGEAIITTPDFSYTGTVDNMFGLNSLAIQSFFIPKSKHVSLKAFALESSIANWDVDKVKAKVEVPSEDVGPGQELKAVLCVHYTHNGPTMSFVDNFRSHYKTISHLSGFAEEIGCNRFNALGSPVAVGFSIYAGSGATVSIYEVDFEQESSATNVLVKMEQQAKSAPHGFCFVLSHDMRRCNEVLKEEEEEDWLDAVPLKSKVEEILKDLRSRMPRTPIFGIRSMPDVLADTLDKTNSNAKANTEKYLCYGFLMVTYE